MTADMQDKASVTEPVAYIVKEALQELTKHPGASATVWSGKASHRFVKESVPLYTHSPAAKLSRLQNEIETATGYAERLSVALMEKHFPEATTWKPLSGDLVGILTQIDNLTTGLCRKGGRE